MRTYSLFQLNNFSGGLNTKAAPMSVDDNQATGLLNCEFDLTGALVKRRGCVEYNATPLPSASNIDNMIRFYKNAGTRTLVATAGIYPNNKVFKGDDASGVFTEITGGTALSPNKQIDMLEYRDTLFLSNGVQLIQYYSSGSTKADVTGTPTPPTGKYLAVCDNRLFVAGNSAEPNTIFFSDIALFSSLPNVNFPANNFIRIPKQDTGDVITGMAAYRDELFVFRRNDVWALLGAGPEDYCLQELNNRVGAVCHRAIANTGAALVFAAPGHIHEFRDGAFTDIGLPIESVIAGLKFDNAVAEYYPAKMQVWICAGTTAASNDRVLMYDCVHKAWSMFDLALNSLCSFNGAGDGGEFYGGAPGAGRVWRMDSGTDDNGADIAFSFSTKHFSMSAPQNVKRFRRLYFDVNTTQQTGAFDVAVSVDFGRLQENVTGMQLSGFNRWGEFVYGQAPYGGGLLQTGVAPLHNGVSGKYICLTLSNSDKESLTIYSLGIQNKTKPIRGE